MLRVCKFLFSCEKQLGFVRPSISPSVGHAFPSEFNKIRDFSPLLDGCRPCFNKQLIPALTDTPVMEIPL